VRLTAHADVFKHHSNHHCLIPIRFGRALQGIH